MAEVVILTRASSPATWWPSGRPRRQGLAYRGDGHRALHQIDVNLNLFMLSMSNQSLLGTVFGSVSPRVQIPNLLRLYQAGQLQVDELITQEYTLDQVQNGYDDLEPAPTSAAWSTQRLSAARRAAPADESRHEGAAVRAARAPATPDAVGEVLGHVAEDVAGRVELPGRGAPRAERGCDGDDECRRPEPLARTAPATSSGRRPEAPCEEGSARG